MFQTNLSNTQRVLADNLNTLQNYTLDASPAALGLASNEYVTQVTFLFGRVPGGFRQVETPYIYDDLFQIGCLGLCKAAQTDKPGHTVAFSTYAYRLIRNEIYTELERATRRGREVATDPAELPCTVLDDDTPEQREACSALLARLERAEAGAAGVTAKGFQAIRMLMDGYTNREIGEMFGVPANHVTAWVSRARKALGASE